MLYIFHVDAGTMFTFDMNIALQSVANLKQTIERKTKIPGNSLVLLVSGGEVLQGERKVSSYSAGTDTNPIFMFSKLSIRDEIRQTQHHSLDYDCDLSPISDLSPSGEIRYLTVGSELRSPIDMKPLVEACCSLPPCHTTVAKCAQIAQQFADIAVDFARSCQQLVHDQHLQHQGWAAVVANLEDIYNDFCERSVQFKDSFKKHRQKKDKYHQDLVNLNDVIQELGGIPMLTELQSHAEAHRFSAFDECEEGYELAYNTSDTASSGNRVLADFGAHGVISNDDVFPEQKSGSGEEEGDMNESDEGVIFSTHSNAEEQYTLLRWIMAKGNRESLDDIIDYCKKGLHLMETDPSKESEVELYKMLEFANKNGLKQIKGIENRLYGLDELMVQVRRLEKEQMELANALVQNRDRVSAMSDPSVLPTLCSSHRLHLHSMLKNHETLIDLHRRFAKSKDELSVILKVRLGTVLKIENLMSKQDAHYMLNYQCFSRLARYFDVVEQLHRAPQLYTRAVHETVRRRLFSQAFLQWASELACHLLTIYNDEVVRRQEFNSQFHGHFLSALFPGTEDMPPTFATQAPTHFDSRLPNLSEGDVEFIASKFPDYVKEINKCNMESVVEFFKSRMGPSAKFGKTEQGLTEMIQAGIERGFDSESEAADSGKVTEKSLADASTDCTPETVVVSTITEETMESLRADFDRLRDFLIGLYKLCRSAVVLVQSELARIRSNVEEQKQLMKFQCDEIQNALTRSCDTIIQRMREQLQKLTVDHELEMSDIRKILMDKDDTISSLHSEMDDLKKLQKLEIEKIKQCHEQTKIVLEKSREDNDKLERKIEEMEVQKQKELKELQDKMHLEYKAEIESLRSRFRLVALTNMDRSPSESSLEKIERTDVIEITSHNAIVLQTKENMEVEKEEAVKEAVEQCEKEWEQKILELKNKHEADKQITLNESVRRIIDEKDRQLEQCREKEAMLIRECNKYKETIQQLSDPETSDYETLLKTQLASLENEKAVLAAKVEDLMRDLEMRTEEKEVDRPREDDADESSSSRKDARGRDVRGHTPLGVAPGTLSLSSCLPGHTVLLLWDRSHHSYTVLQEAPVMYFVHSDSLPALDLSINVKNECDRKLYAIATVDSKEYCYAKKSGNRYHIQRGSRFYRVRVRPPHAAPTPPPCCEHKHARTQDIARVNSGLMSSTTVPEGAVSSVPTATDLIALSPMEAAGVGAVLSSEEAAYSLEAEWGPGMHISTRTCDMESSVAPVSEPPHSLDLALQLVSSQPMMGFPHSLAHSAGQSQLPPLPHGQSLLADLIESEVAEEATP